MYEFDLVVTDSTWKYVNIEKQVFTFLAQCKGYEDILSYFLCIVFLKIHHS